MIEGLIISEEELVDRVLTHYGSDDILELLGIETEELARLLWDKIVLNYPKFSDILTEFDYEQGPEGEAEPTKEA